MSGTIQLYDRNEQKSMKLVTKIVGAKYNSGVNRRMENGMVQNLAQL